MVSIHQFVQKTCESLVGSEQHVSARWLDSRHEEGFSFFVPVSKNEVMQHTLTKVKDGLWVNGAIEKVEGGYKGCVNVRDHHIDSSEVLKMISSIANSIHMTLAQKDDQKYVARFTCLREEFSDFDIYSAELMIEEHHD